MQITYLGILSALFVGLITTPRLLYLAIVNKKRFPDELFSCRYLILFIALCVESVLAIFTALVFSGDLKNYGVYLSWLLISSALLSLYLVLWIIFWGRGYEVHYQFSKVLAPAPMHILESVLIFLTGLQVLNIPLICISLAYALTGFFWNYKGYKLTKPNESYHREGEDDI